MPAKDLPRCSRCSAAARRSNPGGRARRLEALHQQGSRAAGQRGAAKRGHSSGAAAKGRGGLHARVHGGATRVAARAAARAAGGGAVDGAAHDRGARERTRSGHGDCARRAGRAASILAGVSRAGARRRDAGGRPSMPSLARVEAGAAAGVSSRCPSGVPSHLVECCCRRRHSARCRADPCARRQRWAWSAGTPGQWGCPPRHARPPCPSCCCACAQLQGAPGGVRRGRRRAGRARCGQQSGLGGDAGCTMAGWAVGAGCTTACMSRQGLLGAGTPPAGCRQGNAFGQEGGSCPPPTWRRPPEMNPPSPYRRLPSTTRARPAAELK